MIMYDDQFGFRDHFTGVPFQTPEWTEWDFVLAQVDQLIEDYTDSNGLLAWEVDDPNHRVLVSAVKKVDRFEAAKQAITGKKSYRPTKGEYFVPKLSKTTAEWPTHTEYFEYMAQQRNE